ncbi:hypothetical protein [Endozoicomonas sp. 8E]|uniref:hypothetical protein n=1 Tax=Endozoicomonas sp. 8E TaxID=3035692 RepID=UPI002939346D|nr:hypothetical protein [Endozoicomonas sp. 8E]WOG27039.1 hypothetical protein P6910_21180 [Endozoicomonas sp. 8E]
MSIICRAEPLRSHFVVELVQDAGSPKQNFATKPGRRTFSEDPSNIADTDGYTEPDLPPDDKRHRVGDYRVKMTSIESIPWQWLYATNLLVAHKLVVTIKDSPANSNLYSLSVEVVVAVSWLLSSYWKPDSSLFNSIEQQEATSMLTRRGHLPATVTRMFGSRHDQPQHPPSQSFGQHAPKPTSQPAGYFTYLQYSDSADDNEGPQPQSHTLSLNCYIYPCHGVCRLRPSPDNTHSMSAEAAITNPSGPINDAAPTLRSSPVTTDDWVIIKGLLSLRGHSLPEQAGISFTPCHSNPSMGKSEAQETKTEAFQPASSTTHLSRISPIRATDQSTQPTCEMTVVGEDGLEWRCGKVCKNARTLRDHRRKNHTGQRTCEVSVVGGHGQLRPCGKVCKNAKALSAHKSRNHTEQKACDVLVFRKNGQQWPCGRICRNAGALSDHKSGHHSGRRTCDVQVVKEDGLSQPCSKICKSTKILSDHKRRYHSGQQACDLKVIGEDGQLRTCGKVCNSSHALTEHKRIHRRRKHVDMDQDNNFSHDLTPSLP